MTVGELEVPDRECQRLILRHERFGEHAFEGGSLIQCLARMRELLEPQGVLVLCNGARRDAYSNSLSRNMGGGRKVFPVRPGEPFRYDDFLWTLGEAPLESVATLAEQARFLEEWRRSLPPGGPVGVSRIDDRGDG